MDEKNKRTFTEDDERAMQERIKVRNRQKAEEKKRLAEKKAKRAKTGGKLLTAFKITLAVIVLLSLLFVAAQSLGNVTFTKATDYISQSLSNLKPGPGYPVEIGQNSVLDMQTLGDSVLLLEDDSVILLNSTAKEINRYTHSYSKPLLSTCNGRLLLCDRTTGRYMIADRSEMLRNGELKNEIYCCTIGRNGCYAFSLSAENSSSVVSVYGADNKKQFDFKCANEYIIGLSLSPNGKFIAAIGIGSSKAYFYSKLYIISTDTKKVVSSFDYNGKTLNSVFYSENDTVIAIADSSYSVIKNNKDKKDMDFGYNTISRFSPYESGTFAIVLSKYGNVDSGTSALLDSTGAEIFSVQTKSKIECIDFDGKTLCTFDSNDYVRCYNTRGKLIGQTKLDFSAQRIVVSGRYCYALCFGNLVRLNVRTKIDKNTTQP